MNNDFRPKKLNAVYSIGAGWEIHATYSDEKTSPVLQSDAVVKMFAYAPWLSPFTPKEFEEMIGRVLTEMAEAWNEKNAK